MNMKWVHVTSLIFGLTSLGGTLVAQDLEKLSDQINTGEYDEISPVLSKDGHTLFFTRVGSPDYVKELIIDSVNVYEAHPDQYNDHLKEAFSQIAGREIRYPERSNYNQDIWIAESKDGYFNHITHPSTPLNNALPNSVCTFTNQPNECIVINRFPPEGGMKQGFSVVRRRRDGSWTFPEPLKISDYYTNSTGVNLTLSSDNEVLILSIEQDDTYGANDLYICYQLDDGTWSSPKNLGSRINSSKRETNPALSEDMQTLFFASDRPGSKGTDIYYSTRLDSTWTNWSRPERLGYPVNTVYDDSQPHFNTNTGYIYFSSNRDGSSDLFRMKLREAPEQDEVIVSGRIINTETGQPIDAMVFFGTEAGQQNRTFYVSMDGYYRIKVPKGESVPLFPEKPGFLGHQEAVFFESDTYYYDEYNLDLKLDPLTVDAKITLQPIYFEQSKAVILPRSYDALDYLARILVENPQLSIRIEGHTDNVGKKRDLKRLSEQRAQAVKNFLLTKGIARNRLQTVGYGDARPINANASDEQRRENRRVEFRIVEID